MLATHSSENPHHSSRRRKHSVQSLSNLWVQKNKQTFVQLEKEQEVQPHQERIAQLKKLYQSLHSTSSQAQIQTQQLLSRGTSLGDIDIELSAEIVRDIRGVYEKILLAYADRTIPRHLAVSIASALSRIRRKYTANDPRVMGLVSIQFYYSGNSLLQTLSQTEQTLLQSYIQAIDEHLYLPWQRLYSAAANYDYEAPVLKLAREVLSINPQIARQIYQKLLHLCSRDDFYRRLLQHSRVTISEVRDIEMFQMYLLVCVLEKSIKPVQDELLPICTMLYPAWKMNWELIRQMLYFLNQEMHDYLTPQEFSYFAPYFQQFWEQLSPDHFASQEALRSKE